MKMYSEDRPESLELLNPVVMGSHTKVINVGVRTATEEELAEIAASLGESTVTSELRQRNRYAYYSTSLTPMNWNRNAIIAAIVKARYDADSMDAVRANYDRVRDGYTGEKADEYRREYFDMQDWRDMAKEWASNADIYLRQALQRKQ